MKNTLAAGVNTRAGGGSTFLRSGCYIAWMPKTRTDRLSSRIRASIGRPLPKSARRAYLGFANEYQEQLFRALAAVYPKGVRITDAGWRLYADDHVKLGLFSCAIDGARTYRLTYEGVRRAVAERLIKEPRSRRAVAN